MMPLMLTAVNKTLTEKETHLRTVASGKEEYKNKKV